MAVQSNRVSAPAPVDEAGAGLSEGGNAGSADLELFTAAQAQARTMRALAAPPESAIPAALSALSRHLASRETTLVSCMSTVVAKRDPAALMRITSEMVNNGAENTLLAKTLGKTVSSIDQLTKLN